MHTLDPLLLVAIALTVAYAAQRLTDALRLPTVTGYVILGVLLGGSLVALVNAVFRSELPPVFSTELLRDFGIVGDLALTLVAFSVGSELRLDSLRKVGRSIFLIALLESVGAFVLVLVGVLAATGGDLALALILGAVASATAPAATVMVIRQYRSSGPLTTTVLAVVGLDDAVALMIYSFSAAVARSVLKHSAEITWGEAIGVPALEVLGALALGSALGLAAAWALRNVRKSDQLLTAAGAVLVAGAGLAKLWHLSPLLTTMALGFVVTNRNAFVKNRIESVLHGVSPVLFALFFVLAGARLDATLLPTIGLVGLVYLLARSAGKIGGASLGARLGGASPAVRKYVGFALIPQVGVAVALAILVDQEFGGGHFGAEGDRLATWVVNILLATTIVTEVVGPLLMRLALQRAGEANQAPAGGDLT